MTTEQVRQMGLGRDVIQELLSRLKATATDSSSLATTNGDAADAAWAELKAAATAAGMTTDQLAAYVKQATQQLQQSASATTKAHRLGGYGISTDDMFDGVRQTLKKNGGHSF